MARLFLVLWMLLCAGSACAQSEHFLDLPYGPQGVQRLNLYLPAPTHKPAPLLIYAPGGFWGALDDRFFNLADASSKLRLQGAAIAIVRTRPTPWPAPAQDLAAATAMLKGAARRYRIDPKRIFLLGHSSGGFAVSHLALDAQLLHRVGLTITDIAGFVTLSGLHDLAGPARQGRVAEFIETAFRNTRPAAKVPSQQRSRFLILAGERDLDGFVRDAQDFALKLQRAGLKVIYQTVANANHQIIANLSAEDNFLARELLLDFIGVEPMSEALRLLVEADQRLFFKPALSSESFWGKFPGAIRPYPVDERFQQFLFAHIQEHRYQLAALPLKTYHAIPVAELIKTLPGQGDWFVTRNLRNENYYWPLKALLEYDPVIVVGIDDEKNLFRFGVPYRNKREFSWVERKKPLPSVYRGLGGMLHFRKPPPRHLVLRFSADMSLLPESFSLAERAPLQAFPDLPEELMPVMTHENGCLSCHMLRGVGSLAHHNRIDDGGKQGGLALPLEDYPPEVWHRFVFQQQVAANLVGVVANLIPEAAREPLFELVNKSRVKRRNK